MDNIEVRDGKGQMFYAGQVPWHGVGTGVLEAVTAEEAITLAGLDWEVALQVVDEVKVERVEDCEVSTRQVDA